MTQNQEQRIVSSTGGQKCQKDARFDLIDSRFLWELALVCGMGSKKYDEENWRKGYPWKLSYGALQRHLHAFLMGENYDQESGLHHLAHAAWHCFTLFTFSCDVKYAEFDTRCKEVTPPITLTGGCPITLIDGCDKYVDEEHPYIPGSLSIGNTFITKVPATPLITDGCCESLGELKREQILGHNITHYDHDSGLIDGTYYRGTDFTSKIEMYRRGYNSVDEEVDAYIKQVSKEVF